MKTFLIVALLSISLTAFGQKEWADSSFTNKNEAKNQTVHGLKDGKWIEYFGVKDGKPIRTDKKHAIAYALTIYKEGKPLHSRQYYMDGKIMTETIHRGNNTFLRFFDENGKVVSEVPPQPE